MGVKRLEKLVLIAIGIFAVGVVLFYIFNLPKESTGKFDFSYDAVVNDVTKSYIGKHVTWTGRIAADLSQIDGVKFWIIDKQHQPGQNKDNSWFWSVPSDMPSSDDTKGEWVGYMLKRYGGIDAKNIKASSDTFLVTGILVESDCIFYDNGLCIPNLEVEKIELTKKD